MHLSQQKEDKIAGIQFHLSDELYSDHIDDLNINFGWFYKLALGLICKLEMVDTPYWFKDEYEGIVHCESVMRAYLPPPSSPWKELHSDGAMSLLAFYGIGQLYIMHVNGWKEERTAQAKLGALEEQPELEDPMIAGRPLAS